MAKRKTPEDLEWEQIFSALQFETEPDPKYIKQAVVETKTGKKFRLSGPEFHDVMMHEREQAPEHAAIVSCKITLDFHKIKSDVTKFAVNCLSKSARRHALSRGQLKARRALAKAPQRPARRST
jgi:hypothetical protein